ncbi:MAG TPA: DUF819 family protein [Gemmatimonadaceae bacterium]|nr:DUF819 family protein [Gemmatimonadaceae bacterium]
MRHPLFILAVLCVVVVLSEWLVRRTWLRHAGTALVGILVTAVIANLGVIPAGSTAAAPVPVYDGIFEHVAPLAIFWLILGVNLRDVLRAGVPLVVLFLIGSLGTVAGIVAGMALVNGAVTIGPQFHALGGMFTGTYIGGSINFNAIALEYDVVREGALYAGSVVVDNIVTTIWMVATLALPRILGRFYRRGAGTAAPATVILGIEDDTESLHPVDVGIVLALGLGAVWGSSVVAAWLASRGIAIPFMLVLTIVALALAQIRAVSRLRGSRVLGMFAVYLFLNVIGAFCDLGSLAELGRLGGTLLALAGVAVLVHGVVTFTAARLMRLDADMAAVASQANVGGSTSALALARSLGRSDLVLPAVLIGSLGNAVGNFFGFWVAGSLLS